MLQFGIDGNGHCEIPKGTRIIRHGAFEKCSSLLSIRIPDTVERIGYRAFFRCENLQSVEIAGNIDRIGKYSFSYCSNLKSINIDATHIEDHAFERCVSLQSIKVNAISIGKKAFADCWRVQSIKISGKVTDIDNLAFPGCFCLQSIKVSKDNKEFMSQGNCLLSKDGTRLILGCPMSVIPESVTCIGDNAFRESFRLSSIKLPESVIRIGNDAFYGCNLESIEIPESAVITEPVFDCCHRLVSLTLHHTDPDKVAAGLPDLKKITLHVPVEAEKIYRRHPICLGAKEIIADVTI